MPDKISFSKTFYAMESAIAISQQRHSLIASNISNLDTPDYRAKDIDFKKAMARALESGPQINLVRTNPGHIGSKTGSLYKAEVFDEDGEWNGVNYVNVHQATMKMVENTLMYRAATEILLRKIAGVKEVIKEGGR